MLIEVQTNNGKQTEHKFNCSLCNIFFAHEDEAELHREYFHEDYVRDSVRFQ